MPEGTYLIKINKNERRNKKCVELKRQDAFRIE